MTENLDRYELPAHYAALPTGEFGFPGELRDRLVEAILAGKKTTTTCLLLDFEIDGEELTQAGQREVVIDSDGRPVAVIEMTEVRVLPLGEADLRHAVDEGEGDETVEQWRRTHEGFWHDAQYREAIGQPEFTVDDSTLMVAFRFRLVEDLRGSRPTTPAPRE